MTDNGFREMKDELCRAVQVNAYKASLKETTADEALKFTQSAVNAANARRCILEPIK